MVAEWLGEIWCLLVCSIIFIILGLLLVILHLTEKRNRAETLYANMQHLTQTQEDNLHKVLAENEDLKTQKSKDADYVQNFETIANNTQECQRAKIDALQSEIDLLTVKLDGEVKKEQLQNTKGITSNMNMRPCLVG